MVSNYANGLLGGIKNVTWRRKVWLASAEADYWSASCFEGFGLPIDCEGC
jgi:hypothetical protein